MIVGEKMDKQYLVTKIKEMPEETDPNITINLKSLVINEEISQVEETVFSIIADTKIEEQIRFFAYYSLTIYYRVFEHHTKFESLVKLHSQQFSAHPLNYVVLSLFHRYIAIDNNSIDSFSEAIENAKESVKLLPKNSGVLNNFSELIAIAIDAGYQVEEKDVASALSFINRITSLDSKYAKWYYVKGMLLSYFEKYEQAQKSIHTAIDLENASTKDSIIRMARYNTALLDIRTKITIKGIEENIRSAKKEIDDLTSAQQKKNEKLLSELDDTKSKYLELLAFFSSIIAFVTSSINIISNTNDFLSTSSLIIILAGSQSLAFCIFRLLLSYNRSVGYGRVIISVLASVLIIVLGFSVYYVGGVLSK